ncbi:MAG: hypothetical protein ACK5HO_03435 [Pseudomonadota bacterium]
MKPRKSIFEFALRARKITILGALATQFREICGLAADNERCRYLSSPSLSATGILRVAVLVSLFDLWSEESSYLARIPHD